MSFISALVITYPGDPFYPKSRSPSPKTPTSPPTPYSILEELKRNELKKTTGSYLYDKVFGRDLFEENCFKLAFYTKNPLNGKRLLVHFFVPKLPYAHFNRIFLSKEEFFECPF